eukprot:CAMPEP_0173348214 /NCGR_PEP_ID=MMETSP1144-20121109/13605_1 /TAXON_ID=483371 /ORGANISM="non described non described, Strain CCMP2298" /LENGTH=107 /DNA_ID=CAMNT_0014295827 /DNA_START=207 /DNA_END=526 /DNA_ORIENTATION=+
MSDGYNAWSELLKLKTWEDFFTRTPCVKSSYLWGVGCGSLMMAHKTRLYRGNLKHAVNAGLLTFMVVSSISFTWCVHKHNQKYEQIRLAFSRQKKIKQDPRGARPPP